MTDESRIRQARLVVVAPDRAVRGVVGPVELPEPWWHETLPITEILPEAKVSRLIAADEHRLLLEPMPGADGYDPSPAEERVMVESLVNLQVGHGDPYGGNCPDALDRVRRWLTDHPGG